MEIGDVRDKIKILKTEACRMHERSEVAADHWPWAILHVLDQLCIVLETKKERN